MVVIVMILVVVAAVLLVVGQYREAELERKRKEKEDELERKRQEKDAQDRARKQKEEHESELKRQDKELQERRRRQESEDEEERKRPERDATEHEVATTTAQRLDDFSSSASPHPSASADVSVVAPVLGSASHTYTAAVAMPTPNTHVHPSSMSVTELSTLPKPLDLMSVRTPNVGLSANAVMAAAAPSSATYEESKKRKPAEVLDDDLAPKHAKFHPALLPVPAPLASSTSLLPCAGAVPPASASAFQSSQSPLPGAEASLSPCLNLQLQVDGSSSSMTPLTFPMSPTYPTPSPVNLSSGGQWYVTAEESNQLSDAQRQHLRLFMDRALPVPPPTSPQDVSVMIHAAAIDPAPATVTAPATCTVVLTIVRLNFLDGSWTKTKRRQAGVPCDRVDAYVQQMKRGFASL